MSQPIDHVATANRVLRSVDQLESSEHIATAATVAQAHATLALVEQQRIANVIALHRHEVQFDIGNWSRLYLAGTEELLPEIKEALGL